MIVTVRKYDKDNITLHCRNLRIGDFITPKEELFDAMKMISELIETSLEEECKFVVVA